MSTASSNYQRTSALRDGLSDVISQPFGAGPGTAGPASAHNIAPARIAENYYLQIGQEVGWLGLGLFIAILVAIVRRLLAMRAEPLARVLLASLVGISFINLVSHAWTDDTLALIWWGLAGVVLAPLLLKPEPSLTEVVDGETASLSQSAILKKNKLKPKTNKSKNANPWRKQPKKTKRKKP